MKNVQRNLAKYFLSSVLLVLAFGPTFGFGMFSGIAAEEPRYSNSSEGTENHEKTGHTDKTGTASQFGSENTSPQRFAEGNANTKENTSPGDK